ncbi:MAG TPA: VIT domain-containing protein [Sedimentisphaerales bacterium]|nr:VIT domain-containing protein [Sedimentisphaerales bacterium]
MKSKAILTALIVICTATILVGYFVGCGQTVAPCKRAPAERAGQDELGPAEEVAFADIEPAPAPAEPAQDLAPPTTETHVLTKDAHLKFNKTEVSAPPPKDGPAYADELNYPKGWKATRPREESERFQLSLQPPQSGQAPTLGDSGITGPEVGSSRTSSGYGLNWTSEYDASGADGDEIRRRGGYGGYGGGYGGYGGGYGGYGGGYGGYGGGGYGPRTRDRNPARDRISSQVASQEGLRWPTDGRLPVDLMTVNADEVWVIVKAKPEHAPRPADDDTPGCGAMLARRPKEEKEIPLPLKHTDVKGQISGYIATVDVTQQFRNPYDEKIEAIYVFPLPQNAAINEFIMTIGERKIRGIIRERQEAEKIYQEAKQRGHVASLLTQERPNIFTQKVANIEPGKAIDVNIKYFNTLAYVDGWYEFVFPMVVGPRFNPPCYKNGVGAVGRGKAGISGQKTEVQYLKPHERSGHDISVAVDIDAGVAIEEVVCPSHAITNSRVNPEKRTIKLSSLDTIPNKDFVLRYKVAGKRVKSALVTHRDERGGYFTLMLYPPENLNHLKRAPMEMIFVLDCSGSMRGKPIAKAKDAITRALRKLQPGDTFQVIRFSNNASQLGPTPLPVTPENIRRGLEYVESLQGGGGTMMIEGIKAALDFEHDPSRFRLVSFMTDGYIGNEVEILAAVHEKLGASRIFSFGVGSSVNRFLLDRMAKLGKGAVAYIGLDESAGEVVDAFYERISHPALADVTIDWGGMDVTDIYPRRLPDLFVGRPVIITGKFTGEGGTTVHVTGKVGDMTQDIAIPVDLGDKQATHPGIACVWARKRIEDLANQATYDGNPDLPGEIKQVALEYGLMSAYTAFVAVDSSYKTAGDHGISVAVPVPVPDGVRYDTTVQD